MNDTTDSSGAARRIDAAEANRMAQELNESALGESFERHDIPTETRTGDEDRVDSQPAILAERSELVTGDRPAFPPDMDADATVGGDPETQQILREEESR